MLDITFDYIWDNIVIPMSNRIYDKVLETDKDANISVHNLPQDKDAVYELYEEVRGALKQKYHYHEPGDKERRIDIHKVSACFANVIMEYKIYRFEVDEQTSDELFLSNAKLAYNVSLAIIKDNLVHKYEGNDDILDKLQRQDLMMPRTTDGHDRFNLGRIKTLVLNDIFLNDFDILSYSDMLYWVELFNIMLLEGKSASNYVEDDKERFCFDV
ncbi:hypothetical protein D5282_26325 [bacterium 1xD8-48]|nr:hypothetical protein [bacterium 1xD8-48]